MSERSWRTPLVVLVCGTMVMGLTFGIRMTYGLWLAPASDGLGWGIDTLSSAMAIQSLGWGVATPILGAIADRWGTGRVVVGAVLSYALGLLLMAGATTQFEAILGIGVLTGIAMGGTTASIVLTAISRVVEDEKKRGLYTGIARDLNNWENHRTNTAYDNQLIVKTFLFQFVNSYFSLFYIAFVKDPDGYWIEIIPQGSGEWERRDVDCCGVHIDGGGGYTGGGSGSKD